MTGRVAHIMARAGDTPGTTASENSEEGGRIRSALVPALSLRGVWKLFGPARRVRAALRASDGGGASDREAIKRRHGVFAAVAGVDLAVNRHEILAIVGASGSGKSTLVRHMNGLIQPSWGSVEIDGRPIDGLASSELQRLRSTQVGMVFQNTSLFPHRSVLDNVVFGLEVRRLPHRERYQLAREWLQRVELAAWADHFPHELSGGMQQRVGLARTFVTDPETLLLDEPFSALDPVIRRTLQDMFVHLARTLRKTAVFITHDFAEAVRVADRIGVMVDGRIVQLGTPRQIVLNPASDYVASFATPEIRRQFVCAADLARPQSELAGRPRAAQNLASTAPLSEIISRLQAEDGCFQIQGADGEAIGWIDRGVLLAYLGRSFEIPRETS